MCNFDLLEQIQAKLHSFSIFQLDIKNTTEISEALSDTRHVDRQKIFHNASLRANNT